MSDEPYAISLHSVEQHNLERPRQRGWLVTFAIQRGIPEAEILFRTFIGNDVPEEHVISLARSHLAHTFERVAQERAAWKLTKEQLDQVLERPKPS